MSGAATQQPQHPKGLTYEEYLLINDGHRYELFEGELVLVPSPNFRHQHMVAAIEALLREHVKKHNMGLVLFAPFDVVPAENVVLQPDVLYLSRERYHLLTGDHLKGVPDLAVEVISPSTGHRDRLEKSRLYLHFGVKEYWVADPAAQTLEIFSARENGWFLAGSYGPEDTIVSPLLPGLSIPGEEIFTLPEGLHF